jgi:ligand-binding SRPBCC domain-containing protein
MKTHVFECEMLAPLSVRDTFSVFEDPYNLARITPPWLHFKILTANLKMRKGAEIDYSLAWMRLPMRWKTGITEYEPPFLFVDEMTKGPYSLWRHRHTFRPSEQGTIVTDRVEYALPLGPLGEIAHQVLIRRQIKEIFLYRQRILDGIFAEISSQPLTIR